MALKEYIPGAAMAEGLLDRGKNMATQKGKEVVRWGANKAIDSIEGGVRFGLRAAGFVLIAVPFFLYKASSKKH